MSRPTLTLCMIVKDEEHIIRECLESAYQEIDRYDITDTGSTDKTKEIIKQFFDEKGIPGTIYDEPWEGFGKSRTKSLRNADKGGADYSWVIDADDKLNGRLNFKENCNPEVDVYALNIERGGLQWWRNQIFKNDQGWEYVGVLHEYADCPKLRENGGHPKGGRYNGKYNIEARTMGNRTQEFGDDQVAKYTKDAETLVDCLTNPENPNYEPNNHRYHFYAAQSYFDAQKWEKAIEWYTKRAELGGWEEEQWFCVFRIGLAKLYLGNDFAAAQDHFMQAYNLRPHRAEPIFHLGKTHRLNGNDNLCYLLMKGIIGCNPRDDILFIDSSIYDWAIWDELGATCWKANDFELGAMVCEKLLSENKFPEEHRKRIQTNYDEYKRILTDRHQKEVDRQVQQQQNTEDEKQKRAILRKQKEQDKKVQKRRLDKKRKSKSRNR